MSEPMNDVSTEETLVAPAPCALCGDKSDVQIRKLDFQMYKVGCMTCHVFSVFPGNKLIALRMWNDHQEKIRRSLLHALSQGAAEVFKDMERTERDIQMYGRVLTPQQRQELDAFLEPFKPHFR